MKKGTAAIPGENAKIGIFDSGIGGLTVLKEIHAALPGNRIAYLGDTARVPYGNKSPETVTRYSIQNTGFLLSRKVGLVVVACNTASAVAVDSLRREFAVPVIGVVEAGARAAVKKTRTGRVGVIGTEATVASNAYTAAIKSIDRGIKVFSQACPLLVPLAEEGWLDNDVTRRTLEIYLKDLRRAKIDVLVLGCTHYPLLKKPISRVIGQGVQLIDSAFETAMETRELLTGPASQGKPGGARKKTDAGKPAGKNAGKIDYFVSDSPFRFQRIGKKFLGEEHLNNLTVVDLTKY